MRCRVVLLLALAACDGSPSSVPDDAAIDGAPPSHDSAPDADAAGLACPTGSTLLVERTACAAAPGTAPAALFEGTPSPGEVVSLHGLAEGALPCVSAVVCTPDDAPVMLFSDDPEDPATSGVLYADTVGPGRVRVYVYHVNAGSMPRKFSLVALGGGTVSTATIVKEAVGVPGADYVAIGKQVATAWLGSQVSRTVTIPANDRIVLHAGLDAARATTNQLVHAIIDLELTAAVKLSVVSVLATDDAAALTSSLALLPYDGLHDRGTFPSADLLIVADVPTEARHSARRLRLGGDVTDPHLPGRDATRSAPTTLRGNYGVAYRLLLAGTEELRVAASARGGAWAGAMRDSATRAVPVGQPTLATTTDAIWLGRGAALDVRLVSGGGSSLPLDIALFTSPGE